jgi:hypothetical protein
VSLIGGAPLLSIAGKYTRLRADVVFPGVIAMSGLAVIDIIVPQNYIGIIDANKAMHAGSCFCCERVLLLVLWPGTHKQGEIHMGFEASEKVIEINARLEAFMREHIYPREHDWEEFTLDPANLWQGRSAVPMR